MHLSQAINTCSCLLPSFTCCCCAASADLKSAADYEALLRKKFVGVPEDWVPAIAQQAATSTPSPAGTIDSPREQLLAWVA
jgi:hypothetical protein